MKKSLLLILLMLVSCQKEKPKENFDYITFTPMHSAVVKITDLSKYKLEFSTQINGETKVYGFYEDKNNDIWKELSDGELILYLNVEETNKRISITHSLRKKGSGAESHSIMYIPIEGTLKERGQDLTKSLNCKFTLLDGEKKNLFMLKTIKIK